MRTFFLAAAATIALAGATAMAQNDSTNSPATNGTTTTTNPKAADSKTVNPPANATTTTEVPAKSPSFVNLENTDMLSSNIVGLDIYNQQNNQVGKIQDIAFNDTKKITAYILSVGGFLGLGTHYVAVDPDSVAIKYDASNKTWRATMNATKDQLKAAPEFKYGGQWTASRS
jgi:sporulation protein YlmC with PRC-barrel domain